MKVLNVMALVLYVSLFIDDTGGQAAPSGNSTSNGAVPIPSPNNSSSTALPTDTTASTSIPQTTSTTSPLPEPYNWKFEVITPFD